MGSLDRLREILRNTTAVTAPPRRDLVYEPLPVDGDPLNPIRAWPDLPGAREIVTPYGPACVVEQSSSADGFHGIAKVGECRVFNPTALEILRGRPLDVALSTESEVLFVDLETTGLHGGAGMVAFLVGIGSFDETGAFVTRQFFLPGFAGERAMLHAVSEAVADAALVVTYNGGSFDLPIMETRWLFHRLVPALDQRPHLDMLPPARRLWKEQLGGVERSCRLVALEESLLGTTRVGDVPGMEIPARYFEFVRTGDATPLEPVLEHNRLDLLSLAVLMARAQALVLRGPVAAGDSRECLALGRVYERAGRLDEADVAYLAAADHGICDRGTAELAWLARARLARRRRRFAEAAAAWREVLRATDRRSPKRAEAIEALAIHHEHRERNLALARALAQRSLAQERDPRRRDAAKHRLDRLDRKLERLRLEQGELGAPTWSLPWEHESDLDPEPTEKTP